MSTFLYGAHVHANGIRQHYLRFGQGRPLIIVPGITSPAATWAFVGERLGRHFDTYVLDVRGRGLSSTGPDLDYSLDTYAADVIGFAAALGLDGYYLLGHSMGGRIAARAGHQDAAIEKLILVDPPVSGPGRRPYVLTLASYLDAIREAQTGKMDVMEVATRYPKWQLDQVRSRAEWLHTCDVTAITATHRGFQEEEIHSDFPKLTAPTLLMVAGVGDVIPPDDQAELKALQPALEMGHFPGIGHMIPFEDLEAFAVMTEAFLNRE